VSFAEDGIRGADSDAFEPSVVIAGGSTRGRSRDSAQLLHQRQCVEDAPVLAGKAVVAKTGDVDQLDVAV
jgi:predicted TIM-barrel enzyme